LYTPVDKEELIGEVWFVVECAVSLSGRKVMVRTGEMLTERRRDAYRMWCSSNDASTAGGASTGLELNREILLLGGGGLGWGEVGEEGIHLS